MPSNLLGTDLVLCCAAVTVCESAAGRTGLRTCTPVHYLKYNFVPLGCRFAVAVWYNHVLVRCVHVGARVRSAVPCPVQSKCSIGIVFLSSPNLVNTQHLLYYFQLPAPPKALRTVPFCRRAQARHAALKLTN
jgi:hypothetical protein